MGKGLDGLIGALAVRQRGLVTRKQLLELGLSGTAIAKRIRARRLIVRFPGVYALCGVPRTREHDLMAATLAVGPDAVISHRSAAVVWMLEGITDERPTVCIPHGYKRRVEGVVVRSTRTLERGDVVEHGRIRVTSPARTMIDLAGVLAEAELEDALDDALRKSLVSVRRLTARVERLGPGVAGLGVLKRLLAHRGRSRTSDSGLENRFRRTLCAVGLPSPVAQHEILDPSGRLVARVDFAYPDARLAIEVDGYAFHSGRRTWEADLVRQNRLVALGWHPLRVTSSDLRSGGVSSVFNAIADALRDASNA